MNTIKKLIPLLVVLFFLVPLTSYATTYLGPTGILYTEGINPDGFNDIQMTGGTNHSIWCRLDGTIVGAISYTGSSWVMKNCFGTTTAQIANGYWTFTDNGTLDDKVDGDFYITNGQFNFATSSITRVFNLQPETGTIGSTTQTFSFNYQNATPSATEVCLKIQEVSDFLNFNPQTYCEPVLINGIGTFSTTTNLTYASTYLYTAEIYTNSTTTPFNTITPQHYINIGVRPWSSEEDFYNNATTTIQSPQAFCANYTGLEGAICNFIVKFTAIPGQVLTQIYVGFLSTLQNVAPISWYFEIRNQIEEIQYNTSTNEGITLQTPFDTEMSMLTSEQLDTWTGNNLSLLRSLTTISLWISFLIYAMRKIMYNVF